jgi:hypothetical protein
VREANTGGGERPAGPPSRVLRPRATFPDPSRGRHSRTRVTGVTHGTEGGGLRCRATLSRRRAYAGLMLRPNSDSAHGYLPRPREGSTYPDTGNRSYPWHWLPPAHPPSRRAGMEGSQARGFAVATEWRPRHASLETRGPVTEHRPPATPSIPACRHGGIPFRAGGDAHRPPSRPVVPGRPEYSSAALSAEFGISRARLSNQEGWLPVGLSVGW